MKIDKDQIVNGLLLALITCVLATVLQTHNDVQTLKTEVRELRNDVDRVEVYVDQLWRQK